MCARLREGFHQPARLASPHQSPARRPKITHKHPTAQPRSRACLGRRRPIRTPPRGRPTLAPACVRASAPLRLVKRFLRPPLPSPSIHPPTRVPFCTPVRTTHMAQPHAAAALPAFLAWCAAQRIRIDARLELRAAAPAAAHGLGVFARADIAGPATRAWCPPPFLPLPRALTRAQSSRSRAPPCSPRARPRSRACSRARPRASRSRSRCTPSCTCPRALRCTC